MTQQFTGGAREGSLAFGKENYQAALDHIVKLSGMTFDDEEHADFVYSKTLSCDYNVILSALQLAIAAQPRPIDDLESYAPRSMNIVMAPDHIHFYDLSFLPKPQERKD